MRPLRDLLVQVPAVYAELGHALLPGRSGEPSDTSPDPRHRPAPANLEVTEHRHQLVRGLRWWVDVVTDARQQAFPAPVGGSVPMMCAVLLGHLHLLADEDQAELQANLWDWVGDAMPLVGAVMPPSAPMLPREALGQVVPVHVAAEALGVSVSTVKRRTVGLREGGRVLMADAAGWVLCTMSDLPPAWCEHCRTGVRTVTAVLAQ